MRIRIVACLLTFILTVGAICPLVEVKADAPIPYSQTELYVGAILANLFATGYAIDISGDMVSDILAPNPDTPGLMSDAQYNDFMKQYARSKGFISYDPDTDIGVYEIDEYFDIDNGVQFTTGIVSDRQQEYIVDYLQKVKTGVLTGTEKLYIPYGVKDWYKSYSINQSMTVTEDGDTFVNPILDYYDNKIEISTPYFYQYDWSFVNDWTVGSCLVVTGTYEDMDSNYHGLLYYLKNNATILPNSPTSVFTADTIASTNGTLYKRGAYSNCYVLPGIDILIPTADNAIYSGSYSDIHLIPYSGTNYNNYLYSSIRIHDTLSNELKELNPEIVRTEDGNTINSIGYQMGAIYGTSQFDGNHNYLLWRSGNSPYLYDLFVDGNVSSPSELASKLGEYCTGNVNIYIGDSWSDAVPIDGGITDSISLDREDGIRVGYVPDNEAHDGFLDITAFIDWYRQWLLSHADGGTLTMDVAITDGGVIVDEDDDDDTLPAPIDLEKTLSAILQKLLTKAKEEEREAEADADDDGFILPSLPKHEALHSFIWSIPIKDSNGIDESPSPVDAAIGISKVFINFTYGFQPYLIAIVVLIIWIAIIVAFLHT